MDQHQQYGRDWHEIFPAVVTDVANTGGTYLYTYSERTPGITGDYEEAVPGRSGTNAREVSNRNLDVSGSPVVWMRIRCTSGDVIPEFDGAGIAAAPANTATITVQEVDLSPSDVAATLRFDQSDGFSVSFSATNTARIDMLAATNTQAGIVNTGAQLWAGTKTFSSTGSTPQILFTHNTDSNNVVSLTGDETAGVYSMGFAVSNDSGATAITTPVSASYYTAGSGWTDFVVLGGTGRLAGINTTNTAGSNFGAHFYIANSTGSSVAGASDEAGTNTLGMRFVGGIYTGGAASNFLGLGSLSDPGADRILFWDESGNTLNWLEVGTGLLLSGTTLQATGAWSYDEEAKDAVGGILDDTATVALNYDDGLDSITAGVVADSLTAGYLHASASPVLFGRTTASAGAGEEITAGSGLTLSGGVLSLTNAPPTWTKVQKTHTDLQTAATTNDIAIYSLAAKEVLHSVVIKTTTAFAGTGIVGYVLDIGKTGDLTRYLTNYNGMTAVSDTNFGVGNGVISALPRPEDFGSATSVRLKATSTGANLNASTAGALDIYLLTSTLP